jgi:hypothetical protein
MAKRGRREDLIGCQNEYQDTRIAAASNTYPGSVLFRTRSGVRSFSLYYPVKPDNDNTIILMC